jgi:hypothetical protein
LLSVGTESLLAAEIESNAAYLEIDNTFSTYLSMALSMDGNKTPFVVLKTLKDGLAALKYMEEVGLKTCGSFFVRDAISFAKSAQVIQPVLHKCQISFSRQLRDQGLHLSNREI